MKNLQDTDSSGDFPGELLDGPNSLIWQSDSSIRSITPGFNITPEIEASPLNEMSSHVMTIGLVDCYRFSQECLSKALENLHPRLTIVPFMSVESCIAERRSDLELIIYYLHASGAADATPTHSILSVVRAYPAVPLVVLSDVEDAQQLMTIRNTLKNGAHGFIPTRTTGIPIALAAIRLVKAGGIFAPMDMVLASRSDPARAPLESARQNLLTSRQMAVLGHMQRGSANKTIAHDLSMSESTVKVHVRNIMRKVGATNRTQAVYKTRKLLENAWVGRTSER